MLSFWIREHSIAFCWISVYQGKKQKGINEKLLNKTPRICKLLFIMTRENRISLCLVYSDTIIITDVNHGCNVEFCLCNGELHFSLIALKGVGMTSCRQSDPEYYFRNCRSQNGFQKTASHDNIKNTLW